MCCRQVFLTLCLLLLVTNDQVTEGRRCETIAIPFCKNLGYNQTTFPNNLQHESQDEALIDAEEFTSLVESGCSNDMVYFLCSLYAPVCTMLRTTLPPCRSLCKSARRGCEALMNRYGFIWPARFSCERFPLHKEQICVGRPGGSSGDNQIRKTNRRSGKKNFRKNRGRKCATTSRRGKLCCKLGRKAAKRGFNCNLKRNDKQETRKTILFRKNVVRKCAKHSSCFHACCEKRLKKKRTAERI